MANRQKLTGFLCGLFTSATILFDWYWNASVQIRPFSEEELHRYEMFLERPRRALPPPDLANDWWMVVLVTGSLFFYGYMLTKLGLELYQSRFITIHNGYLKFIALVGLILGCCAGYLLFMCIYILPTVWKIYMATGLALITCIVTYLVLRFPYHLFLWWKHKRICT